MILPNASRFVLAIKGRRYANVFPDPVGDAITTFGFFE
eukprot:CAMPEP_0204629594 /NCGR_PEP_ID=MMETSP0717-20131115/18461_1 /ASSEMBLY_ACC=CAM_ASM_000666 /TAXON_ID=230516 /ORGANISM="Chaetoceros curvisetus" /LENGTH=37 /DNA_ID= /DNA_START= /DNA_END= /DNA_ORIENTATION=